MVVGVGVLSRNELQAQVAKCKCHLCDGGCISGDKLG